MIDTQLEFKQESPFFDTWGAAGVSRPSSRDRCERTVDALISYGFISPSFHHCFSPSTSFFLEQSNLLDLPLKRELRPFAPRVQTHF